MSTEGVTRGLGRASKGAASAAISEPLARPHAPSAWGSVVPHCVTGGGPLPSNGTPTFQGRRQVLTGLLVLIAPKVAKGAVGRRGDRGG